ncbi:poly(rC)-binding protein 3-like [Planococcus citri]|uniref:poly(rC)-binding protein 3-like n=1 Tax=Planococcus citri TaxID=170843 RepID=UPI0031F99E90
MDNDVNITEEDVVITVKILVQDHEVHTIIGENESLLNQIRRNSGASISISDGSNLDRVVIITGTVEEMYDGCRMILERLSAFSEETDKGFDPDNVAVKLIIPASQCGSLIGKGGNKIKEIRDSSGAAMQVSAEMLPHSTERIVHISGHIESILDCIYEICYSLVTSPVKNNSVPYKPTSDMVEGPIVFSDGKAYTLHGTTAVPIADVNFLLKNELLQPFLGITSSSDASALVRMLKSHVFNIKSNPITDRKPNFHKQEYRVPDSCAGGMIGKNGIKISEIRQISGAVIHLPNVDENAAHEMKERMITLEGTRESVAFAKFLINASIELQKTNFENTPNAEQFENVETESATSTLVSILSRPGALNVVSSFLGYQNISEFVNSFENYRF